MGVYTAMMQHKHASQTLPHSFDITALVRAVRGFQDKELREMVKAA
jgi:hypothetical protein